MANDSLRGRQTVAYLTNKSGGGVVEGDVVIVDDGNANAFTTTAVEGVAIDLIGVVLETIANNAAGRICFFGYVPQINLDGAAALGEYIVTDGVAKQGTPAAVVEEGVFAQVLAAGAAPAAIVFNAPQQVAAAPSPVEISVWEQLEKITLGAPDTEIDFAVISQDYEDLWFQHRLRTDNATSGDFALAAFNGDAVDANYYSQYFYSRDAASASREASDRLFPVTAGATSPAGYFAYGNIFIQRYTESEFHIAHGHSYARQEAGKQEQSWNSLHWETADPITQVTWTPRTGANFVAGCEIILFGRRLRTVLLA